MQVDRPDVESPLVAIPKRLVASRFQIVGLLGRGGTSEVYRALDTHTGRHIALKALRRSLRDCDGLVADLRDEAEALTRLAHSECLPALVEASHDTVLGPYIAMRIMSGEALSMRTLARTPWSADATIAMTSRLLRAVTAAHAAGVVHRDIKPANVLCDALGRPSLVDFGSSCRVDGSGVGRDDCVVGTPGFMAPEQFAGRSSIRSDLFGVGAVSYAMVSGRAPYTLGTGRRSLYALVSAGGVMPPCTDDRRSLTELWPWLERGLRAREEERYPSALAMSDALAELAGRRGSARDTVEAGAVPRIETIVALSLIGALVMWLAWNSS